MHISLDFLGCSVVCERQSLVVINVVVTVSAIGGTAGEFDGARAAGGMAAVGVLVPP